jgi:8-amino-7-oxononanoate synthase
MPAFKARIQSALSKREQAGLTRTVTPTLGGNCTNLQLGKHQYLNFSSNDYLGLANDHELKKVWQQGIDLYGVGSAASPMVTGFSHAHLALENALCEWLGYEKAVIYNSGFSANQALLFSLLTKDDLLIQDRLNHASLM